MFRFVVIALLFFGSSHAAFAGEWTVRAEKQWQFALANTGRGFGFIESSASHVAATPSGNRMTVAAGREWFLEKADANLVARCKVMKNEARYAEPVFGGGIEVGCSKERDLPDGLFFVSIGLAVGSEWFPKTTGADMLFAVSARQEGSLGMRTVPVRLFAGAEFLCFGVATGPSMAFSAGIELCPFR